MKKLLTSFAVAIIFSIAAQAQDATTATIPATTSVSAVGSNQATNPKMKNRRANRAAASSQTTGVETQKGEKRKERYEQASPEQKARMDSHRAVMEKLSPEQKAALKQEITRHRQAMKQFGFGDDMLPPAPREDSAQ